MNLRIRPKGIHAWDSILTMELLIIDADTKRDIEPPITGGLMRYWGIDCGMKQSYLEMEETGINDLENQDLEQCRYFLIKEMWEQIFWWHDFAGRLLAKL